MAAPEANWREPDPALRSVPELVPVPRRVLPSTNADELVIPGLDATASVEDQIEQCEQLITLRLQSIDSNFAEINKALTTELLPALRRFAIATEPIRDVSKFWVSFFQATAQIKMTVDEDYESPEPSVEADQTITYTDEGHSFHTVTTDTSFQPPETTSTPVLSRSHGAPTRDDAFQSTIESPMLRLEREMSTLADEPTPTASRAAHQASLPRLRAPKQANMSTSSESSAPEYSPPVTVKLQKPRPSASMWTRPSPSAASSTSMSTIASPVRHQRSPAKGKGRTTPLRENIFRRNLLKSNQRHASPKKSAAGRKVADIHDLREQPHSSALPDYEDSSSDEGDDPTMSPPVTVKLARPNDLRLSRAPPQLASQRTGQGLVSEAKRTEARKSLGIRGMFKPPPPPMLAPGSARRLGKPPPRRHSSVKNVYAEYEENLEANRLVDSDDDDSFDMMPPVSGSYGAAGPSYDSDSSEGSSGGGAALASRLQQQFYADSSLESTTASANEATDTIFGGRLVNRNPPHATRPPMMHIHGGQVLAETIDPAVTDEPVPAVEQSPTPWLGRKQDHEFRLPKSRR